MATKRGSFIIRVEHIPTAQVMSVGPFDTRSAAANGLDHLHPVIREQCAAYVEEVAAPSAIGAAIAQFVVDAGLLAFGRR